MIKIVLNNHSLFSKINQQIEPGIYYQLFTAFILHTFLTLKLAIKVLDSFIFV